MSLPTSPKSSRRVDPDLSALKACIRGLNQSTCERMLRANVEFLVDKYLKRCIWSRDENGLFVTGCGTSFSLARGGIEASAFNFCPFCGRKIVEPK